MINGTVKLAQGHQQHLLDTAKPAHTGKKVVSFAKKCEMRPSDIMPHMYRDRFRMGVFVFDALLVT